MWLFDPTFDCGMTKEDEDNLLRSQPHVPDQPALIPGAATTLQDSIFNGWLVWLGGLDHGKRENSWGSETI